MQFNTPLGVNIELSVHIKAWLNMALCDLIISKESFSKKSCILCWEWFMLGIAWCWAGTKPLHNPILLQFNNVLTHWGQDKCTNLETTSGNYLFIESCCIIIQISLIFVCNGSIDNSLSLVQIMVVTKTSHDLSWLCPCLLTHICVTWPQWLHPSTHKNALWYHTAGTVLVEVMAFPWWHQAITWTNNRHISEGLSD